MHLLKTSKTFPASRKILKAFSCALKKTLQSIYALQKQSSREKKLVFRHDLQLSFLFSVQKKSTSVASIGILSHFVPFQFRTSSLKRLLNNCQTLKKLCYLFSDELCSLLKKLVSKRNNVKKLQTSHRGSNSDGTANF